MVNDAMACTWTWETVTKWSEFISQLVSLFEHLLLCISCSEQVLLLSQADVLLDRLLCTMGCSLTSDQLDVPSSNLYTLTTVKDLLYKSVLLPLISST